MSESAAHIAKLKELTVVSIDEQAKAFLRAFVAEFQGRFEQVLDLVEEFRTYLSPGATEVRRSFFFFFFLSFLLPKCSLSLFFFPHLFSPSRFPSAG
jgi:hypothetical protein